MTKTVTRCGNTYTYKLTNNAILIIEQNGKSTQNQWGGYPCCHVGSESYLQKMWKKL